MKTQDNKNISSILWIATLYSLIKHFTHCQRLFLIPLLLILLLSGIVLIFTSGLSYVAPFVYSAF